MFSSSKSRATILAALAVVLLAAVIPTSSEQFEPAWSLFPYYHVHIINNLDNNKLLYVHCHCTDRSRPESYIKVGSDYEWRFKRHLIGLTRWQCYLAPDNDHHAYFVAYGDETKTYKHSVFWVAKVDGVYLRDTSRGDYEYLVYPWIAGRWT